MKNEEICPALKALNELAEEAHGNGNSWVDFIEPRVELIQTAMLAVPPEDVRAVVEKPVAWLVNGVAFTNVKRAREFIGFSNFEVIPLYRHPQRPERCCEKFPKCVHGEGADGL